MIRQRSGGGHGPAGGCRRPLLRGVLDGSFRKLCHQVTGGLGVSGGEADGHQTADPASWGTTGGEEHRLTCLCALPLVPQGVGAGRTSGECGRGANRTPERIGHQTQSEQRQSCRIVTQVLPGQRGGEGHRTYPTGARTRDMGLEGPSVMHGQSHNHADVATW